MKKLLTLLLTFALLTSLAACGSPAGDNQPEEDPAVSAPGPASSQPEDPAAAQPEGGGPEDAPETSQGGSPAGGAEDPDGAGQPEDGSGGEEAPASGDEPAGSGNGQQPEDGSGNGQHPEDGADKETQSESQTTDKPAPGSQPEQPGTAEPAKPEPADQKAIAQGLIGRPVSELYDAIGQPLSAVYSPSCLDLDTDDGELTYDGFVVYTEGAPDNETVYDVF